MCGVKRVRMPCAEHFDSVIRCLAKYPLGLLVLPMTDEYISEVVHGAECVCVLRAEDFGGEGRSKERLQPIANPPVSSKKS